MSNESYLSENDVISADANWNLNRHPTFKVSEFNTDVKSLLNNKSSGMGDKWLSEGVECEVLRTITGGWQKGKVRLRVEFVPDEPAVPEGHESLLP